MQRQYAILILICPLFIASLGLQGPVLVISNQTPVVTLTQSQETQAQQAINAAQTAINTAYINLVYADTTGSPISDLIEALNGAIVELNQARRAYNATDYATAITLAENAQTTANSISEDAQVRRYTTFVQIQAQLFFIIAVAVIALLITYFALAQWRKYRKEKRRELLQMEIRLPDEQEESEDS